MLLKRKMFFYLILFVLIVLIFLFIYRFRIKIGNIITPFIMAGIIAYVLSPMVHRLEKRKIPGKISILLIYFGFIILMISAVVFIMPEVVDNIRDLMDTLPEIAEQYQNLFRKGMYLIQSSSWPDEVKDVIYKQINLNTALAQEYIMNILGNSLKILLDMVGMFFDFVLALVIAYYFIKDSSFFREAILSLAPRSWRNWIISTGREVNGVLSNFIQGQLLTALIVGVLEIIGLFLTGVKYPLVLGIIGGMANVIPYFGPVIGAIPAVAVALILSPVKALWVILVFIIVQQIDNSFISPKVIEGRLGLHPVSTILAVLIGQEFFGIPGMLFAVPIMAILKIILKRAVDAIAK